MSEKPSKPSMKAFVPQIDSNGPHPAPRRTPMPPTPQRPKRAPEVNEAILERAIARIEAVSEAVDKLARDTPTKSDLHDVFAEVRATKRMLHEKIENDIAERAALNLRLDAMMTMMGNILARLPDPAESARAAPTGPLPVKPSGD